VCGFEVSDLNAIYKKYSALGVEFVAIVFDTNTQNVPADLPFADSYAKLHAIEFRTGIDPQRFNTYKYFDINATPYTMVVHKVDIQKVQGKDVTREMQIKMALMGWDYGNDGEKQALTDLLDQLLAQKPGN